MKTLTDPSSLAAYSADASLFQITPKEVVIPESKEDLFALVERAKRDKVSLTPRGGATSTTGAPLGDGFVIDLTVHLNKILHFAPENQKITVQPGIIYSELNNYLRPHGLKFGPETSTGNRAAIGGMIGNNAAGGSSLVYGTTADALIGASLLLSTGKEVVFSPESSLYQNLLQIGKKHRSLIEKHFPLMPRRSSGYALDALLKDPLKILAGAEGTLGILTEVTLSLVPIEKPTPLFLYSYASLDEALNAVPDFLKNKPSLLELMDQIVVGKDFKHPGKAFLLVEGANLPPGGIVFEGKERKDLLELRRSGLERLFSRRSYKAPCGFLEDISVPPELLSPFMSQLMPLLTSRFGETAVYGHAGAGCLHIRPFVDLREQKELELVLKTMEEATDLLLQYQGVLSGEHGDGLLRSWLNGRLYGEEVVNVFKEVKNLFDPHGMMNPGKIVPSPFPIDKLKKTLPLGEKEPLTFLNFKPEGGLTLAADLCNGNGLCRKKGGFMCPSFQATGEEVDGPRGRAQALREALHEDNLSSPSLQGVLNRCLSCKGCQIECPSHVDIAKMKAEALFRHQKSYGIPLRSRLISRLPDLLPYVPTWVSKIENTLLGRIGKKMLGFAEDRPIPERAKVPFSKRKRVKKEGQPVVLFIDTFTEWFEPEVGSATVALLEYLGYSVEILSGVCCGRTAYSKGMLPLAKEKLTELKKRVLENKIPVIGIEPTCLAMAEDEAQGLLEETFPLISIEKFLEKIPLEKRESGKILLHVHCHKKSTKEAGLPLQLLKRVVGDQVEEIPSGCCGMAGSFGYESEHAELSKEVANLVLIPTIKKSNCDKIVATGFSCRSQIHELTGKRAYALPTLLCELYHLNFQDSYV